MTVVSGRPEWGHVLLAAHGHELTTPDGHRRGGRVGGVEGRELTVVQDQIGLAGVVHGSGPSCQCDGPLRRVGYGGCLWTIV